MKKPITQLYFSVFRSPQPDVELCISVCVLEAVGRVAAGRNLPLSHWYQTAGRQDVI